MDIAWIKSSMGEQVISHLTNSQPVWLFCASSEKLIWCNLAAKLFKAHQNNDKLQLAPIAQPKSGQIKHILELGEVLRASLCRITMQVAKRNIAITALATPMFINNEKQLLIVGVNKIAKSLYNKYGTSDLVTNNLFGQKCGFILLDKDSNPIFGTKRQLATFAKKGTSFLQDFDENTLSFSLNEKDKQLILFPHINQAEQTDIVQNPYFISKGLQLDNVKVEQKNKPDNLTSLLDQLAADKDLFTPLGKKDDEALPDTSIALSENQQSEKKPTLWKIIAKGFLPNSGDLEEQKEIAQEKVEEVEIEQKSDDKNFVQNDTRQDDTKNTSKFLDNNQDQAKYNFEELSRILTKRINVENEEIIDKDYQNNIELISNSLVKMPDEKLILNTLSLGLLIFQDQQILFVNRAMSDLLDYISRESLRKVPLGKIFVKVEDGDKTVGPITHLVKSDGSKVAINARLQSITWNGKAALMLSANKQPELIQLSNKKDELISQLAKLDSSGIFKASRSGLIDEYSDKVAKFFAKKTTNLKNYPLSLLVAEDEVKNLQEFLEQDARFAQSETPAMLFRSYNKQFEIVLFGEGNAGIIRSYFGLARKVIIENKNISENSNNNIDSAMFAHVSRSIRRPLNTIIGFSELINTQAFGVIDNKRYVEYAGDIKTSSNEILTTIDELEEFAKINDENFIPNIDEFDLGELLEECLARVRHLANFSQVLIRSSISEQLPIMKADKQTLSQAILNLFASAIEQSPKGKQIIVSAQKEKDESVIIHVRDSRKDSFEFENNFVMFCDGVNSAGQILTPKISSMGLAITKTMLEVNSLSLEIEQNISTGTLISLIIPANMFVKNI